MVRNTFPKNWAPSGAEWEFDLQQRWFVSPRRSGSNDEFLISDSSTKDGSIASRITFPTRSTRDAGFTFRFSGDNRGYLAGLGGWDSRFCIAKMLAGDWQLIASVGKRSDLQLRRSYLLRVTFSGSEIKLFENNVLQLTANDATYQSGRFGLQAADSHVSFEELEVLVEPRRCFVAMPFDPQFDVVFEKISTAVEGRGLTCVRGDKSYGARPIMEQVRLEMSRADIIVLDLTDKNPNVYYEAGLAHASDKQCVIIAESQKDLGFDLQYIKTVFYGDRRDPKFLQSEIEKSIDATLGADATSR